MSDAVDPDSAPDDPVVEVSGLERTFGNVRAVDDVSFEVHPGQIYTIVGPNGAGKSTTIECLIGLQAPDEGRVRVFDQDPQNDRARFFENVGVQFQESSLYPKITVREAFETFAKLYEDPRPVDEMIEAFDLRDRTDTFFKDLSGGEQRKVVIAVALIGNPSLAIFDEPSSGLDPHARRRLWHTLHSFRDRGLTMLLTTHDMQEAEAHSDVVLMMDDGSLIAEGAPADLVDQYDLGMRVAARAPTGTLENSAFSHDALESLPGLTQIDRMNNTLCLYGQGDEFPPSATAYLQEHGIREYAVREAGLEDLYLLITGSQYEVDSP